MYVNHPAVSDLESRGHRITSNICYFINLVLCMGFASHCRNALLLTYRNFIVLSEAAALKAHHPHSHI